LVQLLSSRVKSRFFAGDGIPFAGSTTSNKAKKARTAGNSERENIVGLLGNGVGGKRGGLRNTDVLHYTL
jgi:hypothetical protein